MTRPLVLVISHDYSCSGAPIILFDLLAGLKAKYQFTVVSDSDGPLRPSYLGQGINAVVLPGVLSNPQLIAAVLQSNSLLVANTLVSYAPVIVASRVKKPSLWFLHEGRVGPDFLMKRFPDTIPALVAATCVAYPSQFSQGLYKTWRGEASSEIVPYGVVNQSTPAQSPRDGPFRILQLGSIEQRKGQDIALAAMRSIGDTSTHLEVVGEIIEREYHNRMLAELKTVPTVAYRPEIPRSQSIQALRECDALIVPSRDEVTPLVILEAMSLGKPVIAAAVGGIPEMISDGKTGLLFEANNVSALAGLIMRLRDNLELRHRLGSAGLTFQREHRDLEQSRRRFGEVLDKLIGRAA